MLIAIGDFTVLQIKHTRIPIEISARSEVRRPSEETLRATGGSIPDFFCFVLFFLEGEQLSMAYRSCVSIVSAMCVPRNAGMRGITEKSMELTSFTNSLMLCRCGSKGGGGPGTEIKVALPIKMASSGAKELKAPKVPASS